MSNPTTLSTGLDAPQGIAVDDSFIYIIDFPNLTYRFGAVDLLGRIFKPKSNPTLPVEIDGTTFFEDTVILSQSII